MSSIQPEKPAVTQIYKGYSIRAATPLTDAQQAAIVRHLDASSKKAAAPLGGRGRPVRTDLPGVGPVIIKQYFRGGLIRYLNRRIHLRWGSVSRPRAEFDRLNQVRKIGINAPEPVAVITRGNRFYRGWLVTRFIDGCRSLAEMCRTDPSGARTVLDDFRRQVSVLIDHRILHPDLHPGNVLIGPDKTVYLIDFDKTRTDIHDPGKLRSFYQHRWHRAVIKYRLPAWLDAAMAGIRHGDIPT